jgi:hypothetical protein
VEKKRGDAMRSVRTCAVWLLGLVIAGPALAQAPQPGPEHERLGVFVGDWTSEGEMKPSPMGPGGKMSGRDHCEWFEGKFAVVCHSEGSSPMGAMKSLGILGYSAEDGTYTYYGTDNSGMTMTTVAKGTVENDTWTYTDESKMGGMTIKSRYTMKVLSPSEYTFKWEMLGEDGEWLTAAEGKNTKAE